MVCNYFITILDNDNINLIGTKGSNLHALSKSGFNVPLTYCITTKAYEQFINKNNLRELIYKTLQDSKLTIKDKSQIIINSILLPNIPQEIQVELNNSEYFENSDLRWAVRSSSNLEDLPNTSFAGLYDSYLNIEGLDNILNSIKKCWASLWNERAIAYREKNNLNHAQATMAVIIQVMVNAEYAGVIFTQNPTSKNKEEMFLEYCEGTGERLVSGETSPYSCKIDKLNKTIHHVKVPEKRKFEDNKIHNLSMLALKVENYFGCPQDIEWAFDGRKTYVLQTRPISSKITSEARSSVVWTRANVGEVLPHVITPLTWAVFQATLLNSPALVLSTSNDSKDAYKGIRRIHGRVYIRLNNFLDSFCYLPTVTPKTMRRVLGIKLPPVAQSYNRPKGLRVRLAQLIFILSALRFLPRLSWLDRRLSSPPPAKPEKLEKLITWNAQCFHLHLKTTAHAIGAFSLLAHFLGRWIPSEAEALQPLILIGHENLQTAAQGISLWQLAEHVRKHSALRSILENDFQWPSANHRLYRVDGGPYFLTMFKEFLDANGARAAGEFELAVPRWREDPTFVLGVIRRFLDVNHSETFPEKPTIRHRRKQKEAISHIKAFLGLFQRWIFTRLLASYSEYTTLRENLKYRLMEGYALLRETFLEMGEDLLAKNILDSAADVFFLTPSEVLTLKAGDKLAQQTAELILARKTQHARWESQDAPDLIADDGQDVIKPQAGELTGIGCSPGIAEGSARVLLDPSKADSLKPGEILVAPYTDPGWTPLFLSCKAVVTEIGGFLSHGATVAREYGIPIVVNVTGVTKKIHTGDLIRVNGTSGQVTIFHQVIKGQ